MVTAAQAARRRRNGSPIAHLVLDTGQAFSLQYTPEKATTGGHAPVFATIDRPGLPPISVVDKRQLRTVTFMHTVVEVRPGSANSLVSTLQALAGLGRRVRLVGFAPAVTGWFNITDLAVSITQLSPRQQIGQAELTWQLQEASVAPVKIGRAVPPMTEAQAARNQRIIDQFTGIASGLRSTVSSLLNSGSERALSSPTASVDYMINATAGAVGAPQSQRIYRTGPNETLREIAQTQLGDPNRWAEIADLNKDRLTAAQQSGIDSSVYGRGNVGVLPAGLVLLLPAPSFIPAGAPRTGATSGSRARTAAV